MLVEFYVVNYDIPLRPQARRRAFYRRLHEILRKHKITSDRSTASVWILDRREVAEEIHNLAASFGVSNLYTAFRTDRASRV